MALTDTEKTINDGIIDLNIEGIKKQKFRINGRNDLILELNLSDMGIAERLQKGYELLQEEVEKIANLPDDADLTAELKKIDETMRKQLDYIFDSNVSEICGRGGTMYDMKDGEFRFESILNSLTNLYTNNLNDEYIKMKKRIQKHTDKYIGTPKTKSRKRG